MIEDQSHHPPIGSLLRIIPWDCEGIERPWGFARDQEIVDKLIGREKVSGGAFRSIVRMGRVDMNDGDVCVLLERVIFSHPTIDSFYVVLYSGKRLCVFLRFLDVL
jgi:hypothetical protein